MKYFVYVMANKRCTTFYTGVTSNLERRVLEHKSGSLGEFTKKYRLHKLVYVEEYESIEAAIRREKRLKRWNRRWKEELFRTANPGLIDLAPATGDPRSSRG